MQLIIKPTGVCNFNCKFCSAEDMSIAHPIDGKIIPDQIREYVIKLASNECNPLESLIITGGEPLCVEPEYYYELYEISNHARIGITSNLKNFYLNPDKWTPIFNEHWFSVTTSFQYGEGRMWDKDTVFTEEMFRKIVNLYNTRVLDRNLSSFIAVIDDSNEDTAIDTVLLAKELNMVAKVNNAIGVGKQGYTYPRYKIFKIYLDIIDKGLDRWEATCNSRHLGYCSRNTHLSCENYTRCCHVDKTGRLHVSICDETEAFGVALPEDMYVPRTDKPATIPANDYITPECPYCNLCRLCNGCMNNRREAKKDPNYCTEMKKLEQRIIDTNWHL